MTCDAVFAVAAALLQEGRTLHACDVTAGAGLVIDWRTVRCGEVLVQEADAFDAARVFVHAVGPDVALAAVGELGKAAA